MKLIGKWRILMQGDCGHFRMMPWNRSGLDYLLGRLIAGEEVADEALDKFGITARPLADAEEVITVPPDASE
jgi:hypothetical protein